LIFIFNLCATLACAGIHLVRTPAALRTRQRVVEVLLLYFLCVQWGFGAVLTALPHIITPDIVAGYIGWAPGSPFQLELGFASLGLGVLGVLCIWLRGTFWLAPAIGRSIFLYGAAWVHLRDIAAHGNLSPGNAGAPLVFDVLIPTIVLALLVAHIRLGGMQRTARSE
jgi:hypothetical protein